MPRPLNALERLSGNRGKFAGDVLGNFARGGTASEDGAYRLDAGEMVMSPASPLQSKKTPVAQATPQRVSWKPVAQTTPRMVSWKPAAGSSAPQSPIAASPSPLSPWVATPGFSRLGEAMDRVRANRPSAGASLPGFKHGGKVPKDGIYKLDEGEVVIPAKDVDKAEKAGRNSDYRRIFLLSKKADDAKRNSEYRRVFLAGRNKK